MIKNTLLSSFLSGLFISIGGTVFIACASTLNSSGGSEFTHKIIGSVMFCVALLSICMLGLYLFTGKVGYLVNDHSKDAIKAIITGLIGNFIGSTLFGVITSFSSPAIHEFAKTMCASKVALNPFVVLFYGVMCGILMFTAVHTYRENKTFIGILFCVPVFIICGFEHSIADMFYFAAARAFTLDYLWFIVIVIIGNAIGGMLIPFVKKFIK
ncbi:MAG: formate/nitrite transporter family protein [Clostridia bacterium]|nr:formate/nitrite transporter family protein [Clostridia bacterium]